MCSATASKGERKAAIDVASWMFNVVTSVGIIMVNKALMATHGFSFGTTFFTTLHSLILFKSLIIYLRFDYVLIQHILQPQR